MYYATLGQMVQINILKLGFRYLLEFVELELLVYLFGLAVKPMGHVRVFLVPAAFLALMLLLLARTDTC